MSNLIEHAKREMAIAGVDKDIYGDMTSKAVLELLEVFNKQGHSGFSAGLVSSLFYELAQFKNLAPLTDNPEEWYYHEADKWNGETGIWQNKRCGEAFSEDEGKTYYLTSETVNGKKTYHESAKAE